MIHTVIPYTCQHCGRPVGDTQMWIGGNVYHPECCQSPYANVKPISDGERLADAFTTIQLFERNQQLQDQLAEAKTKVDDLYNLFAYAEQDEDVLNMTGGKPLIGWLREREEEWYRKGNR